MSGSSAAPNLSNPQHSQESRALSPNSNRRQKKPQMLTSSQDVRYNQATVPSQQQQQWWPQYPYPESDYHPEEAYYGRNNTQHRPQTRQAAPSTTQSNQRTTTRANKQPSTATSTSEAENLRSLLTDQLFANNYECMICMMEIG
jgi:hypothetical protein